MTTRLVGESFEDVRATSPGQIVEDFELDRCTFVASTLAQRTDLVPSLVVRRVNATRCILDNCLAVGIRFEDVTVDNLVTKGGLMHLSGCVLSHVTFKGRAGAVIASPPVPRPDEDLVSPEADRALVEAYKSVDWALDITQAEFVDVSLDYVPGNLIKRDPETQFLLRREHRAELDNRDVPDGAHRVFSRFDISPFDSMVVVAPKRSKQFRRLMDIFEGLREVGLAE
ncbi:hypothetical protein [Amycolatopsis sp. RTGN1]|uniref:hypothetical protein n=1 Tax=Amycolatopsis ponsaeliensis TaxID=2992142 RepID=UPI00254C9AE7|nr:hypothetical protein [Amycolatopsis sp. RTGN1]